MFDLRSFRTGILLQNIFMAYNLCICYRRFGVQILSGLRSDQSMSKVSGSTYVFKVKTKLGQTKC